MKRSEVVNIIADVIYQCNVDPQEAEEIADRLLTRLEKKGIKPPEVFFQPNRTGCLCTMRESCPSCGGWCSEWEKE